MQLPRGFFRPSLRLQLKVAFGSVLAVSIVAGAIVLCNLRQMGRDYDAVIYETSPIISNARHMYRLVVDMETGQRGFIITGADEFLEPYNAALKAYEDVKEKQRSLIEGQRNLESLLGQVEDAVEEWKSAAAIPEIALRRQISEARMTARGIEELVSTGNGKRILDHIRATAADMAFAFEQDGNTSASLVLKDMLKAAVDSETGLRGFLITGREEFLEPYRAGKQDFDFAVSQLRRIVSIAHDREATTQDIRLLEEQYQEWQKHFVEPLTSSIRKLSDSPELLDLAIEQVDLKEASSNFEAMAQIARRLRTRFKRARNSNLIQRIGDIERNLISQHAGVTSFVASKSALSIEPLMSSRRNWPKRIEALELLNNQAYDIAKMNDQIDDITASLDNWEQQVAAPQIAGRRLMNENPATLEDAARMLHAGTGKRILDRIRGLLDLFIEDAERKQEQHFADVSNNSSLTEIVIVAVGLLQLVLGVCIASRVSRGISSRVQSLGHACRSVAEGDYGVRLETDSQDEIGELANSFNSMSNQLHLSTDQLERNAAILNAQLAALDRSHGRIEFDPDGKIADVNETFCRVLEYERDEVVGKDHRLFLSHGFEDSHESAKLWNSIIDGNSRNIDIVESTREGKKKLLNATFSPVLIHGSEVAKVVEYFVDETDQKKLEEELGQARKLESIGQLAAGVAHEINSPLQCVSTNVEFLQASHDRVAEELRSTLPAIIRSDERDELAAIKQIDAITDLVDSVTQDQREAVEDAAIGTQRVAEIVQAMKSFSHPGSDESDQFDLNQVLKDSATITRNRWKDVANLELELDDGMPDIFGRRNELSQVAINLIVNAADAIAEQNAKSGALGEITIRSRQNDRNAIVEIYDNGPGIPREIASRIFDPFFTTKAVGQGTGQGLAICYDIVNRRHGGTIAVGSSPGGGACFRITLPLEGAVTTTEKESEGLLVAPIS